jgi:hypothetical protein
MGGPRSPLFTIAIRNVLVTEAPESLKNAAVCLTGDHINGRLPYSSGNDWVLTQKRQKVTFKVRKMWV